MSLLSVALTDCRVVDPASGFDGPADVLIGQDGNIADVGEPGLAQAAGCPVIDCDGHALIPGLIDLRVNIGEPGAEHRETLASAGYAAVSAGITSMVIQPAVETPIDDAQSVDFILRRGRDKSLARVLVAGALTQGCLGQSMAEMGLMQEAGASFFANGQDGIISAQLVRRILSYSTAFEALIALRPKEMSLSGGVMSGGDLASRLGLSGLSIAAESIAAMRDIRLAQMTGARLLLDMISTNETAQLLFDAKAKGLDVTASVNIHTLVLNEIDVGDYRTFAKIDPPLRAEADRLALIAAVKSGLVQIIVSGHDPRPAEEKRLPFDEASFGASALEALLPALLSLYHDGQLELLEAIKPVTQGPADLLGLRQGRIAKGAPADLALVDLGFPFRFDADNLNSRGKNSPMDGRRLQGKVLSTWVGGERVFDATAG